MAHTVDLTTGSISGRLARLAAPIIATSFVEMAYNLTDMAWVGRLGSNAVAAVGTAGFFTWLASAVMLLASIGAEVRVAQAAGRKDMDGVRSYARHSVQLALMIGAVYALAVGAFRRELIGFFRLGSPVDEMAAGYLVIVAAGLPFFVLNWVLTSVFNGLGDSAAPFRVNALGLVLNMMLDPILIFGLGPAPRLEASGAALATVAAQVAVTLAFLRELRRRPELFAGLNILEKPAAEKFREIMILGLPPAVKNALFASISMVIARIVAQWGPVPVAVQRVGSQIESISWMTAGGFERAMSAFVGQNYGAGCWGRIKKGYFVGLGLVSIIGLAATALLVSAGEPIFALFIPGEPEAVRQGAAYLRIMGVCQWWMCVEIVTGGAFLGHGKSMPPAVVSITFNLLRIPAALALSSTRLGLNGIWWAISLSCIAKGLVLSLWHLRFLQRAGSAAPGGVMPQP